ncbi:MAG TPA: nucleoside diphosphate kinase regulator [Spirochaetota bacterium]|nr:nucleoside diphosphate kinase regulator [Spirochaetota bacterium]HPS86687.1 nucleoside diphosphate kinase regulator [Spirochaetota bacterium]
MKKKRLILNKRDYERLKEIIAQTGGASKKQYIRDLSIELENAEIVKPENIPPDFITMNSKIKFKDIESDESFVYTLVYPAEADSSKGKLSVLAPIGTALLGYRTGDVITWNVPDGVKNLMIEEILYQPEANKDYHL